MKLSSTQRNLLFLIAVCGFIGPNGTFLYYAFFRLDEMMSALQHPVTLAFVSEAFVVMALLAVYLAQKPLRWGWKSFIVFSLIGGLGFSIPLIALLNAHSAEST